MCLEQIAAAYRISDEHFPALRDTVAWVQMELLGPDPIPEPIRAEDPIPDLVMMASELLNGIAVFRQRHRLNLTYMEVKDKDLAEADNDVTEMLESLRDLANLLKAVPLSKKGRPDIRMYNTIYNLGAFWKYIGRPVKQNFANDDKIPEFARFICDIVECYLLRARIFDLSTVRFSQSNDDARRARSRIESQIKYVVAALNNGKSKRAKTYARKRTPA